MKPQNTQLKSAGPRITSTIAGLLIRSNTYRAAVLALFFAGATLFSTSAASAAPITVKTINDSGPGSLRKALVDANDGDTINFHSSLNGQRITLTSGQLNVDKDVTISGPGAEKLAVDGNNQSRVFYVNPGKTVTIDGLAIKNGRTEGDGSGGGILNVKAALTVTNCTLSGNTAPSFEVGTAGGGICNAAGVVTVTNCMLEGNVADSGGGIANAEGAMTVTNCTFSGNSVVGIVNSASLMTLTNCTIKGNSGGGIFNSAYYRGGAKLTITNSTISGNPSVGVHNQAYNANIATLTITSSTISGNGIQNVKTGGGAAVATGNTIFDAGSIINSAGTVTSLGHNLSSDGGGGFLTGDGDQINTNPLLGPLQANGGATFTHALLPGSPAINHGAPNAPLQDQRYYLRSGAPDVGAFEFGGTLAPGSAVSRKAHGSFNFDINLPVAGTAGIECRSGGATNGYQLLLNFPTSVTVTSASVTTGVGSVSSASVSGAQVTVNLSGVTNAQRIVVTLFGVSDGTNLGNVTIPMGFLVGDSNGDGFVNAGDALQTRNSSGQATNATNFRSDVNIDGTINSGDTIAVRSRSGTALP